MIFFQAPETRGLVVDETGLGQNLLGQLPSLSQSGKTLPEKAGLCGDKLCKFQVTVETGSCA